MAGRASGQSVTSRALAVLDCFDLDHPRLTLSHISRRSGLPLATAHRLIAELVSWRALRRGEDGLYEIGSRLWNLGLLSGVQAELREVASPFLNDVYAMTRESVHLAVRDGLRALYVDKVAGRRCAPVLHRSGGRLPLHATGVGKVLLAYGPPDMQRAVLADLAPQTLYTVTDPARLSAQLVAVRRHGYATTWQEMSLGASSVAVPVYSADGTVAASISVVGAGRVDELLKHVPLLRAAATGLSRALAAELGRGEVEFLRGAQAG